MSGLHQRLEPLVRPCTASDQAYICSTWFHSALGHNRAPSRRRRVNDQIDRVLDDSSTRALIACDPGDQRRILGWIVYATAPAMRLVHYLYVREEERKRGVGTRLVNAAWPGSTSRIVTTMRGPKTNGYIEQRRCQFVPLEDFLR